MTALRRGTGDHDGVAVGATSRRTQTLTEEEERRAANLGRNGPRDVTGLVMTHCVPNEHVVVAK